MPETETQSAVNALPPGAKSLLLPAVAVKLALGAKAYREGENVRVDFEDDPVLVHPDDFQVAVTAARKIKSALISRTQMSIADVLSAYDKAKKFVTEQVFKPGSIRVLYYPVMTKASSAWRCLIPSLALNRQNRVTAHVSAVRVAREALDYDVIVFQIDHTPSTQQFARALQSMGKKVVYEIDDALDALEPWHPQYAAYDNPDKRANVTRMLGLADAVSVTTKDLAERFADKARRICVLPNWFDLGCWPRTTPHGKNEFRILWAGSQSHKGDLEVVAKPLESFAKNHPDVHLYFFGDAPPEIGIAPERIHAMPFVSMDQYPTMLAEVQADVAIAPLTDCPFNHSKSNIKILEYWATGYPVIASDVGPYKNTIAHGSDGILCRNEGDWDISLNGIYTDKNLQASLVGAGDKRIKDFDVDRHVSEIEDFFHGLVKE